MDYDDGPGMYSGPFGEASGRPAPVAVETFRALQQRQTTDRAAGAQELRGRVNLLELGRQRNPRGHVPRPDGADEPRARDPCGSFIRWPRGAWRYPDRRAWWRAFPFSGPQSTEQPRGRPAVTMLARFLDHVLRHPAAQLQRTTSTCSTCPASTRSTCRTGPTETPAAGARCSDSSRPATATAASSSTQAASCPTTCRWFWSTRHWADPAEAVVRCCRAIGASIELIRIALQETRGRTPTWSRPCAGRSPARHRPTGLR